MYFTSPFGYFPILCKGAGDNSEMCGAHLLTALKRYIHFSSSHSSDVQRQGTVSKEDVVIHPFLKNDSKRKLHALK